VAGIGVNGLRGLGRAYLHQRYRILFYTLLFTLVAGPVAATFDMSGVAIESLLAISLVAAVVPVDAVRRWRVLPAGLAVAWLARPVTAWLDHQTLSVLTLGIWTLGGLLGAAAALRFALKTVRVDAERIHAALSAYLLAGIYCGLLYWVLEQVRPGTFTAGGELSRASAMYFSFVTLATVGYGDIVPRTDLARGVAILEAVGGQLFLAVLVARLVSVYSRTS
jgi:hypothetical protein